MISRAALPACVVVALLPLLLSAEPAERRRGERALVADTGRVESHKIVLAP